MLPWWIVNTVIVIQVLIVYLIMWNCVRMAHVIRSNREWYLPWPSEADSIKTKFKAVLDDTAIHMAKIANHSKFVVVLIALTVIANITNSPMVYIPFWAGIGFAIEHFLFYFKIAVLGDRLNQASEEAEQTFCDLIEERVGHGPGE